MFETMQSFLAFFFPVLALIIVGILFEEKIVAFEQRVFKKTPREDNERAQARPTLRKVERKSGAHGPRSRSNRAA